MKEYIEANLMVKKRNEKDAKAGRENEQDVVREDDILLCMQHFVEKAGGQWRDLFNQF